MDTTTYRNLVNYLEKHEYPLNYTNEQQRHLAKTTNNYLERNNILFRKNRHNLNIPLRVISLQDKDKLLYNYHSSPLGRYFEIKKTIENIKKRYYWPNLTEDVKYYIELCDVCQRTRKLNKDQTVIPIKVTGPFDQ